MKGWKTRHWVTRKSILESVLPYYPVITLYFSHVIAFEAENIRKMLKNLAILNTSLIQRRYCFSKMDTRVE